MDDRMKVSSLPDLTLEKLGLSATPNKWPSTGKFKFFITTIQAPWEDAKGRKSSIEHNSRHEFIRDFLASYDIRGWACATGTAAVVRRMRGEVPIFDVIVNGVKLESFGMALAPRYALRLKRRGIDNAITLCGIKIEGGGTLPDGKMRSYTIHLDQPEMRDQIR